MGQLGIEFKEVNAVHIGHVDTNVHHFQFTACGGILLHGISKNHAFSGHNLPNYTASLKYAFSAENSAGITGKTLLARGRCNYSITSILR